ncbi:thiamine diphosphokinase [Chryseobacterium luquanense]|uniref:Thiamine diphosphokinase n=1 Tax=Chryseobacterium luquanense TaxID=2983766 RepID=A0ABT3Y008_9FLAO|nr:thiamine diphosphokinase [Chryseobacterium luquanense]MCX8531462.1 thiamine diphosphokinase [Chryseobacterium luquanense]
MTDKVLLFINGDAPKSFPNLDNYRLIACTDGAFHYLKELNFPLDKLDFISGDFDSHSGSDENVYHEKFIHTPDQNRTDFYKALEIIFEKGLKNVDVFGGSGGEQDHFLGNLTVAFGYKNQMNIQFFDEFSEYYFIPKSFSITGVKDKIISLYPFPVAESITTRGLKWNLENIDANMTTDMLTRNLAIEDKVSIEYLKGDLLFFAGKKK